MNKDPETEQELEAALKKLGVKVIDHGDDTYTAINEKGGGGKTSLEADNYTDALFEAWNLYKT